MQSRIDAVLGTITDRVAQIRNNSEAFGRALVNPEARDAFVAQTKKFMEDQRRDIFNMAIEGARLLKFDPEAVGRSMVASVKHWDTETRRRIAQRFDLARASEEPRIVMGRPPDPIEPVAPPTGPAPKPPTRTRIKAELREISPILTYLRHGEAPRPPGVSKFEYEYPVLSRMRQEGGVATHRLVDGEWIETQLYKELKARDVHKMTGRGAPGAGLFFDPRPLASTGQPSKRWQNRLRGDTRGEPAGDVDEFDFSGDDRFMRSSDWEPPERGRSGFGLVPDEPQPTSWAIYEAIDEELSGRPFRSSFEVESNFELDQDADMLKSTLEEMDIDWQYNTALDPSEQRIADEAIAEALIRKRAAPDLPPTPPDLPPTPPPGAGAAFEGGGDDELISSTADKGLFEVARLFQRGSRARGEPIDIPERIDHETGELLEEATQEETEVIAGAAKGPFKTLLDKILSLENALDDGGALVMTEAGDNPVQFLNDLIGEADEIAKWGTDGYVPKAAVIAAKLRHIRENAEFSDTIAGREARELWADALAQTEKHHADKGELEWVLNMGLTTPSGIAETLTVPGEANIGRVRMLKRILPPEELAKVSSHLGYKLVNAEAGMRGLLKQYPEETLEALFSKAERDALNTAMEGFELLERSRIPAAVERQATTRSVVSELIDNPKTTGTFALKQLYDDGGGAGSPFGLGLQAAIINEVFERSQVDVLVRNVKKSVLSTKKLRTVMAGLEESGLSDVITHGQRLRIDQIGDVLAVLEPQGDFGAALMASEFYSVNNLAKPGGVMRRLAALTGIAEAFILQPDVARLLLRSPTEGPLPHKMWAAVGGALALSAGIHRSSKGIPGTVLEQLNDAEMQRGNPDRRRNPRSIGEGLYKMREHLGRQPRAPGRLGSGRSSFPLPGGPFDQYRHTENPGPRDRHFQIRPADEELELRAGKAALAR